MTEVGNGLEYLEGQNLSHRDLKPANILITDKQNPVAVIIDFGLVKTEGVTPIFCPPEGFKKNGTVPGKSDIFSFGVTLLSCFFEWELVIIILFENPESFPSQFVTLALSDPVLQLVKKMINYDPSKRPDILQVQTALQSLPAIENRITTSGLNMNLPGHLTFTRPGNESLNLSQGCKKNGTIRDGTCAGTEKLLFYAGRNATGLGIWQHAKSGTKRNARDGNSKIFF